MIFITKFGPNGKVSWVVYGTPEMSDGWKKMGVGIFAKYFQLCMLITSFQYIGKFYCIQIQFKSNPNESNNTHKIFLNAPY